MNFDRILSNRLPIVADPNYLVDSNYPGFDYSTNCPADPNWIAVILDNFRWEINASVLEMIHQATHFEKCSSHHINK